MSPQNREDDNFVQRLSALVKKSPERISTLCAETGVTPERLARWRRGLELEKLDARHLGAICRIFSVSPNWLLGHDFEESRETLDHSASHESDVRAPVATEVEQAAARSVAAVVRRLTRAIEAAELPPKQKFALMHGLLARDGDEDPAAIDSGSPEDPLEKSTSSDRHEKAPATTAALSNEHTSDALATKAAHLVGLAGDFIDWDRLSDKDFAQLLELVDVSQPEMSDALFEALSLLLQDQPLAAQIDYDPLFADEPPTRSNEDHAPAGIDADTPFRVIRGGRR